MKRPKLTVLYDLRGVGGYVLRMRDFFDDDQQAQKFYDHCEKMKASPQKRFYVGKSDNVFLDLKQLNSSPETEMTITDRRHSAVPHQQEEPVFSLLEMYRMTKEAAIEFTDIDTDRTSREFNKWFAKMFQLSDDKVESIYLDSIKVIR